MQLSEIFYWLLSMSITASLCCLIILLIRLIPQIPKGFIRHLWIIPFIRLVFPFGLPAKYGLLELTAELTRTVVVPVDISSVSTHALAYNHVALAEKYVPFTYKTDMIRRIFDVASLVWIAVCVVLLVFFAVSYISVIREHRNAVYLRDNIFISKSAVSPFLIGVFRPKIILPHTLQNSDNTLIISHEKSHIRALDNLSRIIAVTVCILHWFNPLMWLFLKVYLSDLEYACDERVLKELGTDRIKNYAGTLINAKKTASLTVSGIGSSDLSKRIKRILSYKKLSVISVIFTVLLFAATAYILLSNGQPPNV